MSDCRKCARFEECIDEEDCGMFVKKPMTNADRIRAMPDEELAEFISGKARTFGEEYEGYMSALYWLKEEAEDAAND